jgi:adenine-specific DNA-methyltransferase
MLDAPTLDQRREAIALATPAKHKSALGQFMTPSVIARFMAGLFQPLTDKNIRLLDAGAGIGSLCGAFAERAAVDGAASVQCEAWEIDPKLHEPLASTLSWCAEQLALSGCAFDGRIQSDDFILAFADLFGAVKMAEPTHAILNPPYKKISSSSAHRHALRLCGIETANLYSAFVALALLALANDGELVAITPRSFCNGPYFRPFRELLLARAALLKVHVFESRTQAFAADEVLQENVIFHLLKGGTQGPVTLSSSTDATFADHSQRLVPFDEIVLPGDGEKVFHLVTRRDTEAIERAMRRYHHTLADIGLGISTGPVVDFRMREHLRVVQGAQDVPLVYAHHFEDGFVVHPKLESKKPNYIEVNQQTRQWLMPTGFYVVVRRLSSKEERRRIVPAVFAPDIKRGEWIGFDNKTNVFHRLKGGLPSDTAKGLALYLASTFADQWLRRFSGHTQVNASDLRTLRYPDTATLQAWGQLVEMRLPDQLEIDAVVGGI